MTRSDRQRRTYIVAIMFGVAPVVLALIRAAQSHYDLRMLAMAAAAFVGTATVMAGGRLQRRRGRVLVALAFLALGVGMGLAGWVAMRLGATAAAGIWPVAFVLTACWVASFVLAARARRERRDLA